MWRGGVTVIVVIPRHTHTTLRAQVRVARSLLLRPHLLPHLQVGSPEGVNWDLVNHDKLPPERVFRLGKKTRFSDFKALVAASPLGIPVEAQRCGTKCGT